MSNLFELTGDYLRLLEMAQDADVDAEAFADTLEGLEGELEQKADGYVRVMTELDGNIECIDKEIARLKARKDVIENNKNRMKANLQKMMEATGKTKFKTDFFSYNIKKNPPSLVIDDESQIPFDYWIPQPAKVDKKAIKEAISGGTELAFAHLEQGTSLVIK